MAIGITLMGEPLTITVVIGLILIISSVLILITGAEDCPIHYISYVNNEEQRFTLAPSRCCNSRYMGCNVRQHESTFNSGLAPLESLSSVSSTYVCIWFISPRKLFSKTWRDRLIMVLLGISGGSVFFPLRRIIQ